MKIIDAHLHFCPGREYFDGIAVAAGHENTEEHLREEYRRLGTVSYTQLDVYKRQLLVCAPAALSEQEITGGSGN